MKYKWLNNKKSNSDIIIFFNGWGMDESVVNHLNPDDFNVLMFYDYETLETDFDFAVLLNYSRKYLVAWSMGVMTATLFDINYDFKTAVNGTLTPIDDKYGIPERIYNLTVKGFSPKGAERFIKSMFNEECNFPKPIRSFEEQKNELAALSKYKSKKDFQYDRVILSSEDKIIPTKNQINFWQKPSNLHSGHYPFKEFLNWKDLV